MPTHSLLFDNTLNEITAAIAKTGYIIIENAFSEELLKQLYLRITSLNSNDLQHAKVGRDSKSKLITSIRSDKTCWLDEKHEIDHKYLTLMDTLRSQLNASLFLGLFEYECHFAIYEVGTYYKKHLDVLGNNPETYPTELKIRNKNRVVSSILYLNQNWNNNNGGELLLFDKDTGSILKTIYPKNGRLVLFLSEEFPHEVRLTKQTRYSITGWFRVNESI
jgi:SM-20-related protein